MVRKLILLAGCTLVFLLSCENKQNKNGTSSSPEAIKVQPVTAEKDIQKIDEFFDNPFVDKAVKMPPYTGASFKEIESLINPILKTKEENVQNQYDKAITDKRILITTEYYSVGYYYSEEKKEYMLESFVIDDSKPKLKFDIALGLQEDDIVKIAGKYDMKIQGKDSYTLVYFTSQSVQINFTFKNGKLSSIGFTRTV